MSVDTRYKSISARNLEAGMFLYLNEQWHTVVFTSGDNRWSLDIHLKDPHGKHLTISRRAGAVLDVYDPQGGKK